jgi:GNAT superfamily N-acetyltransferase
MYIRPLDPVADLTHVVAFYRDAPDYWQMAEGRTPGIDYARNFFTDAPPGCDLAQSHRLGLFLDARLSGLAELSFGFPDPGDAYLGFMMLGDWARGFGLGTAFLNHVEDLARTQRAPTLFLAVLDANPRGRAFWLREGFHPTGKRGEMQMGDKFQGLERLSKDLTRSTCDNPEQ